jgi:hypothetical protein
MQISAYNASVDLSFGAKLVLHYHEKAECDFADLLGTSSRVVGFADGTTHLQNASRAYGRTSTNGEKFHDQNTKRLHRSV